MVTAVSNGGGESSPSVAVAWAPAATEAHVLGDADRLRTALDPEDHVDVDLVVLALVGEVDVELGVRAVGDPVGRVRVERLVADLDGVDPGAVQARRRLAAAAAAAAGRQLLAERVGDRGGLEPLDPGQELALLEPLGADVGVAQRVLDQRDDALAVDHVGGEEHLHRAGDLVDRAVGRLGVRAQRGADLARDLLEPVAAHLHRDQERALRRGHVARRGDLLGLLVLLLRLDLVAGDLRRQVTRARVAQEVEERLADLAVGVAHDRGDVAVVVLERVLLGGVAAAVDDEDQQGDDDDEPAQEHELPDQHGLPVGAARRGGR